jgi:hypothetical protein
MFTLILIVFYFLYRIRIIQDYLLNLIRIWVFKVINLLFFL